MKTPRSGALMCAFFFVSMMSLFAQGSLTPPGSPAPTMKTLTQIDTHITQAGEKRIDVATLGGDSTNEHIISAAGSYYLSGNIAGVTGKNGIEITVDNVTLDLNGFSLIGVSGSLSGIIASGGAGHKNLQIRNGIVTGWPVSGIDCSNSVDSQFDHLIVSVNGSGPGRDGLVCGYSSVVDHIDAHGNSGNGIYALASPVVTACSAYQNGGIGFLLSDSSTITASAAFNNGGDGFSLAGTSVVSDCNASSNLGRGFYAGSDSTIKGCTATANHGHGIEVANRSMVVDCSCTLSTTGDGIKAIDRSTVKHCVATGNSANGIEVGVENMVTENNCASNGNDGILVKDHSTVKNCVTMENTGNGIEVGTYNTVAENTTNKNAKDGILSSGGGVNRIESNHANLNTGIGIHGSSDWIVKNTAGSNTGGNFVPATGPDIAPIQTASTATNPFANLQ